MKIEQRNIIPVVLFTYARPVHLNQVLGSLKKNNVPLIYAFSDGPKNKDRESAVLEVRKILNKVDWCDIKIVEREKNLGLGVSVRTGVEEVFKYHDKCVVIEDDIVLLNGAYEFICKALEFYENEPDVMSVSLWSDPKLVPKNVKASPVFFCPRFNCWGWGTYRKSWVGMERTALEIFNDCKKKNSLIKGLTDDYESMAKDEITRNIWAVRFGLLHILNQKVNVWPTKSWVENIGLDGSGTNSTIRKRKILKERVQSINELYFPKYVRVNANAKLFAKFYKQTLFDKLIHVVSKLFWLLWGKLYYKNKKYSVIKCFFCKKRTGE
ncbi:MAG: hypothetical protein GX587_14760 [Bacteroidales bacterium]|nr:hypothetical protein [Bacteroidales bacterium]